MTVKLGTFSGNQLLGSGVVSVSGSIVSVSHWYRAEVGSRHHTYKSRRPHTRKCWVVWCRPSPSRFFSAALFWTQDSLRRNFSTLTLVCSRDLALDQENMKEDNQTVEVIDELTGCTSLLYPNTLVSLTSSWPRASLFFLPPTAFPVVCPWAWHRLLSHDLCRPWGSSHCLFSRSPHQLRFHSCTLSLPKKGVSNLVSLPSLKR